MKNVVDASFILDFLLPDEQSTHVIKIFEEHKKGKINFTAPAILSFEIANGLKYAVKSKRITENTALELLGLFLKLDIDLLQINLEKALGISLGKDISIYDASYVCLAESLNMPFLTLDKKLKKITNQRN